MGAFFVLLIAIGMCIVCPTSSGVVKSETDDDLIFAHTVCIHWEIFIQIKWIFSSYIWIWMIWFDDFPQSNRLLQICRHGDRNSYEPYPNDQWKDKTFWPGGYVELTDVGKQQHYALGEYFRKRYAKLLGNGEYSADKVYVYSTVSSKKNNQILVSANQMLWNYMRILLLLLLCEFFFRILTVH